MGGNYYQGRYVDDSAPWCHLQASKISECAHLSLPYINDTLSISMFSCLLCVRLQPGANKLRYVIVGWDDTAVILLLATMLDFDVNAWMPPDERVYACDLPNMFQPLQFRRGTMSTPRKLLLMFVAGKHFVLLKPNPPNAVVRPGPAANEDDYFNGNVATGLYGSSSPHDLTLCCKEKKTL
jgi:hypothetical protein